MNTLSIVASFGALVWIFQDGNLSALLGFQPLGFVETTQPVILFCVLFGLSMDYEVFLLIADEGGLGPDRRQRRGGRGRDGAERPDRHLGGAHRGRRRRFVRVRRHRADQGARDRDGDRGGARRHRRPGAARAGHDAPARSLELVDAGRRWRGSWPAGCPRRRPRWRPRSDEPPPTAWPSLAVVARPRPRRLRRRRRPARRSSPTRPRPRPSLRARTRAARGRRRSTPRRPATRRRPARPADRVVVLHRPPARRPTAAATASSSSSSAPSAAASRRRGSRTSPITDETGDRFLYSQRLEVGPQVDRSPRDAAGVPLGFDLSIAGADPSRPETAGRPPWTMSGTDGHDHLHAALAPDEAVAGRLARRSRPRPALAATKPAALHDHDGWIDFGPAGGSYYYSRTAMTRPGTLDARRPVADRRGVGLVRPPVGRLHLGRRRRLGLVRGQPRRRHRPDALARPRRRRHLPARSTARSSAADGTVRHLDRDAFRSRSPTAGPARRPAPTTRPAGRSGSRARTSSIDLRPTVADQELDTRATTGRHLLGGLAGRPGDARGGRRSAARATSS